MTEADVATLTTLQVHTVLDLRSEPEVATRGIGPLECVLPVKHTPPRGGPSGSRTRPRRCCARP